MGKINIPKLPHGEGTISYFNDDTLIYKKTLKGKRVSVYGTTVKEVLQKMKEKEKESEKELKSTQNITLNDAMEEWLDIYKKPKLKPKSYDRMECSYKNQIAKYPLGRTRLNQIKDIDISKHISNLISINLSYSTIKKCYDLLNEFFRTKYIREPNENPMLTVALPTQDKILKPVKDIVFFDDDDISKFVSTASEIMKTRNKPKYTLGFAFISMIYTGLRAGEMIALRWGDVDLINGTMTINKSIERVINRNYDESNKTLMEQKGINKFIDVEGTTKNKSNRIIHLNSEAIQSLSLLKKYSEYTKDTDYVIAVRGGKCNNLKNMTDRLHIIEKDAGMKVQKSGLHTLRHTCASLYFRNNIPIDTIAKHLGHSVDVCRNTYVHFIEEQMREAASKINLNIKGE